MDALDWAETTARQDEKHLVLGVGVAYTIGLTTVALYLQPIHTGGRLNKKDSLTRYGDSHVKDKTS